MSDTTTLLIDDDDFMAAAQHLLSKIYSSTAVTEKLKILANPVDEKDKLFIRKMEFLVGKNSVHDFASNELPDHVQRFDITLFVGYEPEDIVFLKYPFSFIQRWQRTVLCYLHAASVVQHYSVSRATGRPAKTLDVNNYVRNYFSNFTLRRHLEGVGTCSEQVLRNIILPCMDNGLITTNEICRIVELLKLKGVALLSKFPVEPEFKDPQRFHYHGAPQVSTADPDDGTDRLHSMCIVGFRQETNAEGATRTFFLLQNSWSYKQFVEIDDVYFKGSNATVHFIRDEQREIPSTFSQLDGSFFCVCRRRGSL